MILVSPAVTGEAEALQALSHPVPSRWQEFLWRCLSLSFDGGGSPSNKLRKLDK